MGQPEGPCLDLLESRLLLAGDGLLATYFDNADFTGATAQRVDAAVDFQWGTAAPAPGLGADTFSVLWTGRVEAPTTGAFTFTVAANDGVRLWVDGEQLVWNEAWKTQGATEYSGALTLQAGRRYDLRMEYFDDTGDAVAKLQWAYPGQAKQIVPQTYLYTAAPAAPDATTRLLGSGGIAEGDFTNGLISDSGVRKFNILNEAGGLALRMSTSGYWNYSTNSVIIDARSDAMIREAYQRGVKTVQLLFEYYSTHGALGNSAKWHAIGNDYARRYAPNSPWLLAQGIRDWGVTIFAAINEPDVAQNIDRTAYRNALEGLADGVHAVDPSVRVVPGGFASANSHDSWTLQGYGTAIADLLNDGTLDGIDLHTYHGFWAPIGSYANSSQANFNAVKAACGITRDINFYSSEHNYQQNSAEGSGTPQAITQDKSAEYFLTSLWDQLVVTGNRGQSVTQLALPWNLWLTESSGDGYAMSVQNDPYQPNARGQTFALVSDLIAGMRLVGADRSRGEAVLMTPGRKLWAWHNRSGWSSITGTSYQVTDIPAGSTKLEVYGYNGLRQTINLTGQSSYTVTGLTTGQTYMFLATTTTTATPNAPGGLSVNATGTSRIALSWIDSASNETGFEIERATNSGFTAGVAKAMVAANVTATELPGLTPGTTYYIRVRATNAVGKSTYSTVGSATTPAGGATPIALASPYTQVFTTPDVATSGLSTAMPYGWFFHESGWTSANTQYRADDGIGSQNFTDTHLYGTAGSSDRALGTTHVAEAASTLLTGANLANGGSTALQGVTINYRGEIWRANATGRSDRLNFQYSTDATSLTTGSWIDVDALDYVGPNPASTGQRDGNAAGNNVAVSPVTITFAAPLAVNSQFWIRWNDLNIAGSDDGLAIDDVTITPIFQTTPVAPGGLSATAASTSQVNLAWTDNSTTETGFKIERATDAGFTQNLTLVTTTAANATAYSDTGLTAATTYYYRVRATNAAGDSAHSNAANATTQSATPGLDIRVDFESTAVAPGGNWNSFATRPTGANLKDFNTAANVATITVAGWADSGQGTNAWNNAFSGPSWLDTSQYAAEDSFYLNGGSQPATGTITIAGLDNGQLYTVELVASGSTTQSVGTPAYSIGANTTNFNFKTQGWDAGQWLTWNSVAPVGGQIVISATVANANERVAANALRILKSSAAAPAAPGGLSAAATSTSQVNLAWTDNSTTETGFKIERATDAGFTQNLTLVTTTAANATAFSDTGLTAATTYYYRVRATNAAGDSAHSNAASATTQSATPGLDIRVDFENVATSPGTGWNTYGVKGSNLNLVDYLSGTSSGIQMTVSSSWTDISSSTSGWNAALAGPTWLDSSKAAAMDSFYGSGGAGSGTLSFSGLDNSKHYRIEVIASQKSASAHTPAYYAIGATEYLWDMHVDGYTNGGWMSWNNVAPTSGTITLNVDWSRDGLDRRARLNAIRIVEV